MKGLAFTVEFRGEQRIIVVDSYHDDPDTNGCEIEWHFEDVTPEQHNELRVTEAEENAIIDRIHEAVYEYRDD